MSNWVDPDDAPEWSDNVFKRAEVRDNGKLIRAATGTLANGSGIEPVDVRVLVLPDAPKEKSAGGIFIPETTKEKEKFASMKATVVAVGDNAFAEWGDVAKPKAGDRVLMAQYAGTNVKGDDGTDYRVINDEDIIAVLKA